MWLKTLCTVTLVFYSSHATRSQNAEPRVYEETTNRNDSSRTLSDLRMGGSLGLQYNSSLDAPLVVAEEVNGGLEGVEFGALNNGAADFNLFPEFALVADGLFLEHWRYRIQGAFGEYGFDWSDGSSSQNPYYRNSTSAWSLRVGGGYKLQEIYLLLNVGFGSYVQAAHGIGPSPGPATVKPEVLSTLYSWGLTFGQEIAVGNNSLFLLPEIYYTNTIPVHQPAINFIPQTLSLGFRLSVEFPILERHPHLEEKKEYVYAGGNVRDCRTEQPLEAEVRVLEAVRMEPVAKRSSSADGNFLFRLDRGKRYRFEFGKAGYFSDSAFVTENIGRDYVLPIVRLRSIANGCNERGENFVEGHIAGCGNGSPVRAKLRLIDTSSKFVLAETETDDSGNYRVEIGRIGTVEVEVDASGYFPRDELLSIDHSNGSHTSDIVLCDSVNLESYFDIDRYNLNSEALPHIDRIADYLKKNPALHISIEGHTDNTGARSHNMMLSLNRAQTLKVYLLAKGVGEKQIASVAGYGPDQPIADNATEAGRVKNRRVDMKVLKR